MKESIKLPKLAVNMEKGRITRWLKQVGEEVKEGEPLVEVTTGKINVQVDAPAAGKLVEILVSPGSEALVGEVIAILEKTTGIKTETGTYQDQAVKNAVGNKITARGNFDVIIIGGGPGGYVAAIRTAQLGGRAAIVEKDKLGGTCLNRGCIPSKAMLKSAELYADFKNSIEFGIEASGLRVNISKIMERKDMVVKQLRAGLEQLMHDNGIVVYSGTGSFTGENTVQVAMENDCIELNTKNIIIASGSLPAAIAVPGSNLPGLLNSDTMLEITHIPKSLVIIGGGYIAVEMGCFFNAIGTKVTIIEMLPRILATVDEEISRELQDTLIKDGISIHTGTKVKKIAAVEGGGLAILTAGPAGEEKFFYCENVLNATGRICNSQGLNLDKIGVEMDKRAVRVNSKMQTSISNIYAIGDVTGKVMLAHAASHQGIAAAENIMGLNREVDYSVIPCAVFSSPEIGYVGLTEEQALKQGYEFTVSRFPFAALGKALTIGETKGQCKLICCKKTGKILGAHIIGPRATDLIAAVAVCMQNGLTAKQLARTIFAHPTTAEIIMETANDAIGAPINLPGRKLR